MKIYFCDGCNESIPLVDLESGKALTAGGKIYCGGEECAQSKLLRASLRPTGSGTAGVIGWVALGGALIALILGTFGLLQASKLDGRIDDLPDPAEQMGEIRGSLEASQAELARLATDLGSAREGLREVEREQASGTAAIQAVEGRLVEVERTVGDLRNLLENLRSDREKLQTLDLGRQQLEQSMAQVRESLAKLEGRVAALRAGGPGIVESVAEAGGGPDTATETSFDDETRELLSQLDSRDASVRWAAVDQLASLREPAVTPYLVPLLGDPDAFVQFRVIGTLRELNAREAVGDLIGLLRDGDAIVREEALEALVSLTGNPNRFDVTNGSAADREAGVRTWEDWYRDNRDRFEGSGS